MRTMPKSNIEVVHEGWLIKSPPTKRIWRARWRKRWFTLRQTGELPGQYFLEYYTDHNCRKLKGTINLDQCEQVDAGLHFEQRKLKYPYMFDVKTPYRVYYLAAESENDMNKWVECICRVCQLKSYSSDDQDLDVSTGGADVSDPAPRIMNTVPETPPLSPISGPYIPISECITGRPLPTTTTGTPTLNRTSADFYATNNQDIDSVPFIPPPTPQKRKHQQQLSEVSLGEQDPRFYDMPRQLQPPAARVKNWVEGSLERTSTPPLQSPTDSESVFTDDEWSHPVLPLENGVREPRPSDSSIETEPSSWSVVQRFGKLTVVDSPTILTDEAPPRPPKPSHLGQGPSYLNLGSNNGTSPRIRTNTRESVEICSPTTQSTIDNDSNTIQVTSDEMYDFPRSHVVNETEPSKIILATRHCYNNAAPTSVDGNIFRYDNISVTEEIARALESIHDEEPASPCSQSSCSTTPFYSNLPSPLLPDSQGCVLVVAPPPIVNRGLKPGRKLSDSASICSLPEPSSPRLAPNVDRKLKPHTQIRNNMDLEHHNTLRSQRAAPSPTLFRMDDDHVFVYEPYRVATARCTSKDFDKLQYLDLDLDKDTYNHPITVSQVPKSPGPLTVYKTVDFVKTEAFKRTRQCVEDARKKCSVEP